jgi:hypothetical protein
MRQPDGTESVKNKITIKWAREDGNYYVRFSPRGKFKRMDQLSVSEQTMLDARDGKRMGLLPPLSRRGKR